MNFTTSGLRRYFSNTSWLIGGRVFQTGVGLVVTIGMARILGPDQFGLLNLVLAVTYLIGVVVNFGMEGYVRKELIERPVDANEVLGTYLVLKLGIAIMLYIIMATTAMILHPDMATLVLFLILGGTFVVSSFMGFELWFDARVQSRLNAIPLIIGTFAGGTIKLLLVFLKADVIWFATAILLEAVLLVVLRSIVFKRSKGTPRKWTWSPLLARRLVRQCWPLLLTALAANIYLKFDQVMLGMMLDTTTVGIYAAAVRLSSVWYFIPSALAASLFPAIIKSRSESTQKYLNRVRQFLGLNAVMAYAIMLPMIFFGPMLIRWIYGTAYLAAGSILMLHIISLVLVFLQVGRHHYLLAEGKHHFILISVLVGAFMNIILNLILIPRYGGNGAALATVASQFVSVVLVNLINRETLDLAGVLTRAICAPWTLLVTRKPVT